MRQICWRRCCRTERRDKVSCQSSSIIFLRSVVSGNDMKWWRQWWICSVDDTESGCGSRRWGMIHAEPLMSHVFSCVFFYVFFARSGVLLHQTSPSRCWSSVESPCRFCISRQNGVRCKWYMSLRGSQYYLRGVFWCRVTHDRRVTWMFSNDPSANIIILWPKWLSGWRLFCSECFAPWCE